VLYNDLIAARIRRSNPSIDEKTAREDASALRHVIACVRQAAAIRPDDFPAEDGDLAAIILRTALGLWAKDEAENSHMCGLVESQLLVAAKLLGMGVFDLHDAYIDVRIHVDNIDVESTGLEDLLEPADDMSRTFHKLMEGVTFEDEESPSDGVVVLLEGVTLDEEAVLEDDEDIDDAGARARRRRRRPYLVTEPELISGDDMTRIFLEIMGDASR
jgi:hypothetical protein